MTGPIMTILAQIRYFLGHQLGMPAAVRCVADGTVFLHRRMLEDKRTPFIGVALITELIDVFGVEHAV